MDCPLCGDFTALAAEAIATAPTIFDSGGTGCAVRIFVNDFNPTWQTKFTDLTEASWVGYASLPAMKKWTVTGIGGGLVTMVLQEALYFASTGPTTPAQIAYGAYITKGVQLVCAYRFDTPINVADATVVVQPQFILDVPLGLFDRNEAC